MTESDRPKPKGKGKGKVKGPPPGEIDVTRFAQYPMYANGGGIIVCISMLPDVIATGDVVTRENLLAAAMMFIIGLVAALWAGYSGRFLRLPKGSTIAGLNFIIPALISAILFFASALFGLALLSQGLQ